jgi:hypothetical protein
MLNADGSIAQCRWNGIGGAATGSIGTVAAPGIDATTLTNIDQIATNCIGSAFSIPVSNSFVGGADATNTVFGILQEPYTTGAVTLLNGKWVKGCLASSAVATSCWKMTGTGFPFPTGTPADNSAAAGTSQGPAQRFIVSLTQGQASGVLKAGMNLEQAANPAGTGKCTNNYLNFARSSLVPPATPIANCLTGCTSDTQASCSIWVSQNYNVFSPQITTCLLA